MNNFALYIKKQTEVLKTLCLLRYVFIIFALGILVGILETRFPAIPIIVSILSVILVIGVFIYETIMKWHIRKLDKLMKGERVR